MLYRLLVCLPTRHCYLLLNKTCWRLSLLFFFCSVLPAQDDLEELLPELSPRQAVEVEVDSTVAVCKDVGHGAEEIQLSVLVTSDLVVFLANVGQHVVDGQWQSQKEEGQGHDSDSQSHGLGGFLPRQCLLRRTWTEKEKTKC